MDMLFGSSLAAGTVVLLVLALLLALAFEFVNGFHDTANAVATVIYTKSLKPNQAVLWSGLCNFVGVLTSTGAVAFGIVALLPIDLIVNVGSGPGFAMVFALLLSAIIWNLGTWALGLPASSSHTLIGSIVGVGLANSLMTPGAHFGEGVNWGKVSDTGLSLLISPLIGFIVAGLLLLLIKLVIRRPELFTAPKGDTPPPLWIRAVLIFTCTGVSFAHGSNDGQKGMGLIMLILIGIVPGVYALNLGADTKTVAALVSTTHAGVQVADRLAGSAPVPGDADAQAALTAYVRSGKLADTTLPALAHTLHEIDANVAQISAIKDVPEATRRTLRAETYLASESIGKLSKGNALNDADKKTLGAARDQFKAVTTFIPVWVKAAVAFALGLGTMIGWKRIVVTVGERIGKAHLTYAQGAAAEIVAMATISAADVLGLPVSTTHVLSSGIAGTMFANHSGLQKETIQKILMAWVLTIPVCVFLGAMLFSAGLYVSFHLFGA